ncbi:transketolase [Sphingobium sp. 22B]|uniref:transketolase family protein n=1 Tax=unclassified Sphingobium TaxID=2611147 RepID=UPI000785F384|nr:MULTISPECIES: transketolase [unclassified Sphingobium]KXU29325.1 transketolase [Sphingobium sp. AM]KYC29767.1 transketolase [Sphingobium sp. 22B]OAP29302.1 transketolase [Sphingobium sp. 20006FA]
MRNAFIEELTTIAATHDNIALVVGDLGYSVIEEFADSFPDRFINAGVAEQNMTGLAAGMASEGYHVFTYSIANFPTFRCAEQIRNDVDHHRLPVTVVAVGGGVSYGALGYSHHAVQDYALIRAMPHMTIAAPGDPLETRACLRWLVDNPGPSYLRLGKAGEPQFHESMPNVAPGHWIPVREGDGSAAMLSTGAALGAAIARAEGRAVWSLPLWNMSAKTLQPAQLARFERVTTLEDHLADGGFGSWLMESVAGTPIAARIEPITLSAAICDMVAGQAMLNRIGGLTL